ncbi:DUF6397 family protein [Streptomyces sp. LX-29]|uniref:DUF6397 family protein n=1 Tax=Streptomyces sp. LX-29 TaxID=2900152 RepID=UPI00240D51CC|nr:DUF6397 family protein [Streptomyces sp. LX-29]WFB11126.1 DUF6397 family protein [Streptomyces sp. LX-29]
MVVREHVLSEQTPAPGRRPVPCPEAPARPPETPAPDPGRPPEDTVASGWAARRLGLKPSEFELAVQLGEVRTVATGTPWLRRVDRTELRRLAEAEGGPEGLRERLRSVGVGQGAELLGISPGRFGRLARCGCFTPVRFYVNRYQAVVWLYLATEVRRFAEREPELLTGRAPAGLLAMLAAGEDLRARGWRGRRAEQLIGQTDDPWERAAVWAALLAPDELDQAVEDPHERAWLRRLRPALVSSGAHAPGSRDAAAGVLTADDPVELLTCRLCLAAALTTARAARPAPLLGPAEAVPGGVEAWPPGEIAEPSGAAATGAMGTTQATGLKAAGRPALGPASRTGRSRPLWRRLLGRA